jgi:hypothetical protein
MRTWLAKPAAAARGALTVTHRGPGSSDPHAAGPAELAAGAHDPTEARSDRAADPEPCTDRYAVLDAAALREGNLSRAGIERLVRHALVCETCKVLLAIVLEDGIRAAGTGTHKRISRTAAKK